MTGLFVRAVCSCAFMPCWGLFGYIVPTADQFVRYVCWVHFGRSPVCSGTSSTSDLDCLVCSLRVFGGLHVLLGCIVPISDWFVRWLVRLESLESICVFGKIVLTSECIVLCACSGDCTCVFG
jgi:hypothetical protein